MDSVLTETTMYALLDSALQRRSGFMPPNTDAFRLVNSNGDEMSGLFVDVYGKVAICQVESPIVEKTMPVLVEWLRSRLDIKAVFEKHNTLRARQNGLVGNRVVWGNMPQPILCTELGINLLVDPQMAKTGYFLDLRECRRYIESISRKAKILNCCAFTCSIGIFARRGGAIDIRNIDKSREALLLGQEMYRANGEEIDESEFVCADIWEYLEEQVAQENEFDIVVLDPPEYAARAVESNEAANRYKRLNLLGMKLVRNGGTLVTSCCSHQFSRGRFLRAIEWSRQMLGWETEALWSSCVPADHPLSDFDSSLDYLHILAIRVRKT